MSMQTDVFNAIAHPARRAMLDQLALGELPVNALAERHEISRPAVSQHLRVLRQAGLVIERRAGRERRYRLHPEGLREVRDWVTRYDEFWLTRLDALGDHLEGNP